MTFFDLSTFNLKIYRTLYSRLEIWFYLILRYRLTYGFLSLANGYRQTDNSLTKSHGCTNTTRPTLISLFIKSHVDRI